MTTIPPPENLINTTLQDTYKIERMIGKGGMGEVYEASHARLGRRFAIKLLRADVAAIPEAIARFRREAEICGQLGHPNIVEVIDFNHTPSGAPYVVMELLEGESLSDRLNRTLEPLSLGEAVEIFHQAASALQAVHQRGIVHRDLKPENLFICHLEDRPDVIKVVDFGISKILGHGTLTGTTATFGTPWYMSPEQADGKPGLIDHRTDIFAMGSVVYQMLSGALPFSGESLPSVLYNVVHNPPVHLQEVCPDLPEPVTAVVMKALAKEREERWQTMREMDEALTEAVCGAPVAQGVSTWPPPGASSGAASRGYATGPHRLSSALNADSAGAGGDIDVFAETGLSEPGVSRPSTMSSSVGEMRPAAQPAKPVLPIVLVSIAVVGLLGGALFFYFGMGRSDQRQPQVQPVTAHLAPDAGAVAAKVLLPIAKKPPPDAASRPKTPPTGGARKLWLKAGVRGADVYFNGRRLGSTPLVGVAIPSTAGTLVAKKNGLVTWRRRVKGGTEQLRWTARLRPLVTSIHVVSLSGDDQVWGTAFIDGKKVGHTPKLVTVEPGAHTVKVVRPGYRTAIKRITVKPGQRKRVVLELQK